MSEQRVWTGDIRKEYGSRSLRREDLDQDPIIQFGKWFEEGKSTVFEPNAMALATADAVGTPSVRMVLMKSFGPDGIVFATNYLSRKGREIDSNPAGALLFYWPQLERQARIEGRLSKTSDKESDQIFRARHPMSRVGAIVSHQSEPIESREALEERFFGEKLKWLDENIPRPENWGGYLLAPFEFEFWQGGEHRLHDRFAYTGSGGKWKIERLQP